MINQDFIRQSTGLQADSNKANSIWRLVHTDPPLLLGIILLCSFGLFVLNSASARDEVVVQRQAITMAVGLVVMFIVAQFNPYFFRRWAPSMYAAGLLLLAVVLVIGVEVNGARSWENPTAEASMRP